MEAGASERISPRAIKVDLNATAAEIIYGTGIRLPTEFFLPTNRKAKSEFANLLKERMEKVRPQPVTRHGEKEIFIFCELKSSPYVFLRHDAIRGPLQPPYDEPLKVMRGGEKAYTIRINNRGVTVSVDRLKPAIAVPDDLEAKTAESRNVLITVDYTNTRNGNGVVISNPNNEENTSNRYVMRSERRIHFPDRLQAGFG